MILGIETVSLVYLENIEEMLAQTVFQNKPNWRTLKSDISETVIASCVVSVRLILGSFIESHLKKTPPRSDRPLSSCRE